MPPKTTTGAGRNKTRKTTTRRVLQDKQPEVVEEKEEEEEIKTASIVEQTEPQKGRKRTAKKEELEQELGATAKTAPVKRAARKTAAITATTAEPPPQSDDGGGAKRVKRAGKRAPVTKKKEEKMSSPAARGGGRGRKRQQKAAQASAATETPAGEGTVGGGGRESESSEVTTETQPPSKRRKERLVFPESSSSVPVAKDNNKRNAKKKVKISEEKPEVMGTNATPIFHHSHSTVEGEVFMIGQGDMGQLGLGEELMERKKPHPVGGALTGVRIRQVVCGGMHTVALSNEGKVYTWGCNDEGALGRTISDGEEFTPGVIDELNGINIVQISAGDSHTAALADTGTVYGWGVFRDSNGAFGFLPPPASASPRFHPVIIYSSPPSRAIKISSGSDHIAILTEPGHIYTIGCAQQGQLGRVMECFSSRGGRKGLSYLLDPEIVGVRVKRGARKPKFCDVFCGPYHTFAVADTTGAVFAWGLNNYGQLCTGDKENRYQPCLLEDGWIGGRFMGGVLGEAKNFGVSSGPHHTIVCCDGMTFTCGRKEYGRLGHGEDSAEPDVLTQVNDTIRQFKAVAVEAGGACSFVVMETGEAYSWGMGTNLQLGMSDEDDVWKPEKVTGKKIEGRKTLSVSVGGQHTALLMNIII